MTATPSRTKRNSADDSGIEKITTTAKQMADTVAGVAGEVSARLPEAAETTRDAFQEANRMVRAGSDETLKVVAAFSLGFAGGLLLGGAPRALVLAALVPAALVGSEFVDRKNPATG
jgi:ABC-type transporter Mla subunit MlaD